MKRMKITGKRRIACLFLILLAPIHAQAQNAIETRMSDLDVGYFNPTSREWVVQKSTPRNGASFKSQGQSFEHGVSLQTPTGMRVLLDGSATRFTMFVGHDDEMQVLHPVRHQVSIDLDAELAWRSEPIGFDSAPRKVTLNLQGNREMVLRITTNATSSYADPIVLGNPILTHLGKKPMMVRF